MLLLALGGCGAPPSVESLLEVSGEVLSRERDRLEADADAASSRLESQKSMLAEAFERDLSAKSTLEPRWVREAVSAYVAAREAMIDQAAAVELAYERRIENLASAHAANRRALALLRDQRALRPWPEAWDGWRLRDAVLDAGPARDSANFPLEGASR
ncbi:MAG: hypothetical protein GVY27_08990 [Deinococcus-Thermus bacterium]|nr:hypothetical protein [Deinococcota bacterium]